MSIADHFDRGPETGFVRAYDVQSAHRQFQVSLVLIFALTLAAFVLGLLIRFDDQAAPAKHVWPKAQEIHQGIHQGIHYAATLTERIL